MKTYDFRVQLEPDEEGWRAFCPPLESLGASTWGKSQDEALKNIQEVLTMIVEESLEAKHPILEQEGLASGGGALVSVTL